MRQHESKAHDVCQRNSQLKEIYPEHFAVTMMFAATALFLLVSHVAAQSKTLLDQFNAASAIKIQFSNWMDEFDKEYNSVKELGKRLEIWIANHGTYV